MSTPTLPTDHDEYEALAVAWAVNALEPADQAIFEAHRDGCERCTRAAYAALDIAAELAYGVPDVAPPARLRERVLTAALPHGPKGQPGARPGQSAVLPAGRRAPDGAADQSEVHRLARPASDHEADRPESQRTSRPASDGRADRAESQRTARHASDSEADRVEGRRTARHASDGEAARAQGRRTARPAFEIPRG